MYTIRRFSAFFILILLSSCTRNHSNVVLIQPFTEVDSHSLAAVSDAIDSVFGFDVYINSPKSHSAKNFIQIKSPRYRADSILKDLKRSKPDSVRVVLGITLKDISTTKKINGKAKEPKSKYNDWGIFGLGYRPGPAAIVSEFRLKNKNSKLEEERIVKVAVHEIGHTLGLKHCPNNCVMKDAAETIKTIDSVPPALCDVCKRKIDR